jgi:hypothetical protein
MIIPNASEIRLDERGILSVRVPRVYLPAVMLLVDKIQSKHQGWGRLAIDRPYKPRTMQGSRKLHALVASLSSIWGVGLSAAKEIVKDESVAMGYRTVDVQVGKRWKRVPISEADASTQEEAWLIETALRLGAEAGHDLEAEYALRLQEEGMS